MIKICSKPLFFFLSKTAIGSLPLYISNGAIEKLQPMNANFGIIDSLTERIRNKVDRYRRIAEIALETIEKQVKENEINE